MENEEKFDRRGKSKNPKKLRNLPQYRDMPQDEFDALMEKKTSGIEQSQILEKRIEEKLQKFSEDYDLTDLKINDREILRGLIQAILTLEDYEQEIYIIRSGGITPDNLLLIDKLQKAMSDLRKDISNFQNDLSITRKHRKSDQETSVIAYIDNLKQQARKFYESRMSYIFCPDCNTLLGTIWTLYPNNDNKITLVCSQKDKDDKPCGCKVTVSTKELLENRGTSNREITPDALL